MMARANIGFRVGVVALFAFLILTVGMAAPRAQTAADDQGVLAGFLSRLLSTPTSRVTIGTVEGALSSDAVIRDVAIADDQGVFLTIDRIRLVWRRAALLQRRIEVQRLDIGRIAFARRPIPTSGAPEPGPLLPELPLALRVDAFALQELVLAEPVLGAAARLSAQGSASLGAPSDGLRAALAVRRLDAPGTAELSLNFVPQGERLDLRLAADEPAGGVLARLAQIPGAPPVKIDLAGTGVLDDFSARLTFEGGPDVDARGAARLARSGDERRLTLDLSARIAPLLPVVVQPVFAGVTRLLGDVGFAAGGQVLLRDLRLTAPLAELTVAGSVDADRRLDIHTSARAVANDGGATAVGAGRLARLVFDGFARGSADAPRIEGRLDLAGLATPDLTLESLTGSFVLAPENGGRSTMEASAEVRGFLPANAAIGEAIGRDLRLALRGEIDVDGVARFDEARVSSTNLALSYRGRLSRTLLEGHAVVDIMRLAALSRLAGRPLAGRAVVEAGLTGDPARQTVAAVLEGRTEGLRLDDARLERLLGPTVRLDGRAAYGNGSLALSALRLLGLAAEMRLDGTLGAEQLSLDATASLLDLRTLDERLAGRASAAARLRGAVADPSLTLAISAAEATALGRPVQGLEISLDADAIASAPVAAVTGRGRIGGKPLQIDARLRAMVERAGRGLLIDRLDASLGSVSILADGRLASDGVADGRAALKADNLDDVSPILLTKLAGRIDVTATARVAGEDGARRQDITIRADAAGLVAGSFHAAMLSADLKADDFYGRPVLRGEARASDLLLGTLGFDTIRLAASDGGSGVSALTLEGRASGFALDAAARVRPGPPTAILLDRFRATRGGRTIALGAPATLVLAGDEIRTDALNLGVGSGRIVLAGRVGQTLALNADVSALPLGTAEIFAPGLGLSGVANGSIALSGSPAAPQGRFDVGLRDVSLPAIREAGLPPLAITTRGTLAAGSADINARIAGGRAIAVDVAGNVALAGSRQLDLKVTGTLDAALANRRLDAGQRVAGRIVLDGRIAGSARDPRISGTASVAGGSFFDVLRGVAIEGVEGRLSGAGDAVTIERLTGRARGGGTLSLAGRVAIDPGRAFPGDLRLTARNARLLDSGLARLVADADVAVTGPLGTAPRVSGRLVVAQLDVRVPERLGGAAEPLRDARHVAPPPQTRARLAQASRTARPAGRRAAPLFRATLDLSIDAPGRIFLRGRGIDAELGGSVRIGGTTVAPTALGAFDLRRGRLTILTQRLDFSRGRLTFGGAGFLPELDFAAETRAGDVTARVAVTGPADQPAFAFSSSPSLPEDEVLSRLLFQRAAGGLSPLQALQLAQAATQLSGGGPDAFEDLRRALGVDDLDVNVANGGPTVGISRAIGNRARLNLRAGTRPENSAIGVDIDLTRQLRLQSEIGPDGRASVGVGIEKEY